MKVSLITKSRHSTQVILEQLKGKSLDTCTCYPAHVLLISVYFDCCLLEIQLLMTKTVLIARFKISSRKRTRHKTNIVCSNEKKYGGTDWHNFSYHL